MGQTDGWAALGASIVALLLFFGSGFLGLIAALVSFVRRERWVGLTVLFIVINGFLSLFGLRLLFDLFLVS